MLPDVTARLDADVSAFIAAWDRAADAAQRNAARIRAAQDSIQDLNIGSGQFGDLNAELERLTRTVRQVSDRMREMGNSSRDAGGSLDDLRNAADNASNSLGGGGGGLGGGMMRAGVAGKALAAGIALLGSLLPAVAAAALAAGAALQGLGVVALVVAGGWRGMEQAGERLKASLGGLQKQLESIFRSGLSQEFTKLGHAISSLDGPIKGIAHSVVGVVKEFTGWIRSAAGLSEIETMLAGVDNMVKQLGPGAKAVAQAFTAFGAAAAPAMDEIGKALSSVFIELNKVIQEAKKSGQLEKAFLAGAKAIEAFGKVAAGLVAILIEMAAQGGEPAADAIGKFGDMLKKNAPAIGAFFAELAKMIDKIMTIIDAVSQAKAAMGGFGDAIMGISAAVTKGLVLGDWTALFDLIKKGFPEAAKSIGKFASESKKNLDKWKDDTNKSINQGLDSTKKAIDKWKDEANKSINKFVEDSKKNIDKWKDNTNKSINQGTADAKKSIDKWKDDTNKSINDMVDEWLKGVQTWWDETVAAVTTGVENVITEIGKIPDQAKQALSSWVADMKKIGADAINGIAEGIESAVSNLVGAATRAAQAALTAIKRTLGIRSPSIVFRQEVGAMMMAGTAEGIIANAGLVTDAMSRVGLGSLAAGRGGAMGGAALGRGGQTLTLRVEGGADSAAGTFIARLAQQGKLKITSNAIVGAR